MTPQPDHEPDLYLVEDSETYATCTLRPATDYAVTAVAALDGVVCGVYFAVHVGEEDGGAILAPADARRMAASLLNSADAVDGTTPMFLLADREEELRRARAAALREAADALVAKAYAAPRGHENRGRATIHAGWLRERADEVEAG